jgi:hypothetical protein
VARKQRRPAAATVQRTQQDLLESLRQQFELLKGACSRYDAGDDLEVINIAIRLRVILQGPRSLVGRLHLAKDLRFRDTSTHRLDPDHNPGVANITFEITPTGARWRPLLDGWPDGQPKSPSQRFNVWWTEPMMPSSGPQGFDPTPRYSREDLVLDVAHQDGGAHIDHRDAAYDQLTRDHFTYEIAIRTGDRMSSYQPVQGNPVNACLRQIGYEVLTTLSLDLPAVVAARAGKVAGPRPLPDPMPNTGRAPLRH